MSRKVKNAKVGFHLIAEGIGTGVDVNVPCWMSVEGLSLIEGLGLLWGSRLGLILLGLGLVLSLLGLGLLVLLLLLILLLLGLLVLLLLLGLGLVLLLLLLLGLILLLLTEQLSSLLLLLLLSSTRLDSSSWGNRRDWGSIIILLCEFIIVGIRKGVDVWVVGSVSWGVDVVTGWSSDWRFNSGPLWVESSSRCSIFDLTELAHIVVVAVFALNLSLGVLRLNLKMKI
jgi:hypothetical protein